VAYPIPQPKQPEAPAASPPLPRPKRGPKILRACAVISGWTLVAGLLVFSGAVAVTWLTQKEARSAVVRGKTLEAPIAQAHSLKTLPGDEEKPEPEKAASTTKTEKEVPKSKLAVSKNEKDSSTKAGIDLAKYKPVAPPLPTPPQEAPEVPALATWPRSVALKNTPEVRIVTEDASKDEYIYHTEHFEFCCDAPVGPDAVRHFARVFEATWMLNCQLPLDLRPAPETMRKWFRARILSTDEAYLATGAPVGSGGFYSRSEKTIYVPISNLGMSVVAGKRVQVDRSIESNETLIHEITHQMMSRWLPRMPVWYSEGAAEYTGIADFVHGRFFLSGMEVRLKNALRKRGAIVRGSTVHFPMISISELLAIQHQEWGAALGGEVAGQNYTSALLLTYFLYHLDGDKKASNVIAWLRDIEKGTPTADALRIHLLAGRKVAKLESDLGEAYRKIGIELNMQPRGGEVFEE
jgi:hypothetical protein